MLDILLIKKTEDFFNHYANSAYEEVPVIVTPNPSIADSVRRRFDLVGKSVESITISAFIKKMIVDLDDSAITENYKGKSELIILLGAIWKKVGRSDFVEFSRAFNLLTEFRSFSMSDDVLETVLENYDKDLAEGVLWLHRFLRQLDVVDEHRSYFLIGEKLREGAVAVDYIYEKNIVFYGFDFMTASQVDLIKALGIRDNISIPFYKNAWDRATNFDWIKWFDEDSLRVQDISTSYKKTLACQKYGHAKNYLSKYLNSFDIARDQDILLGVKNLTLENTLEVPMDSVHFKVPINLFLSSLNSSFEDVLALCSEKESTENLIEKIKSKLQDIVKKEKYRNLKCYLMFIEKLKLWKELSDENELVDRYDLFVIFDALKLDLPRLNSTTLTPLGKKVNRILDLRSLEQVKGGKIIFSVNSNHGSVQGGSASYSESVEKYLASIGPIRRGELELCILKERLKEFIDDNEVTLFIENGVLEHDSSWSFLFEEVVMNEKNMNITFKKEFMLPPFDPKEHSFNHVSASRLQTYIDCPRKYYYKYVEKLSPDICLESELSVLELGRIEHEVIEVYFKNKKEDSITDIAKKLLKSYSSNKDIPFKKKEEYLLEVVSYCSPIVERLELLESEYSFKLEFEHSFNLEGDIGYVGSIDCYCVNKEKGVKLLLDFKRSNRIFTSFSSILDFSHIQLWFYLERMLQLKKITTTEELIFGYVDLSETSNSMLFYNSEDSLDFLKTLNLTGKIKHIEEFNDHLQDYKEYESEYISKLINEKEFKAKPFDNHSCDYCHIRNICSRGRENL